MKKLSRLLAVFLCLFSFTLVGCGDKKDTIRINEVTHSIFYAPLYVAINEGYFEDEGINIELYLGNGSDKVMTALVTGSADIGLLGPEACVYVAAQGRTDLPTVFAQLTKKDGSFLFSRNETFSWSELAGKEILAGRIGGMPEMTLEYVLRQKGYSLNGDVNLNTRVSFADQGPAFAQGTGDYTTLFEPTATNMELNGQGYVVASLGAEAGEVPYTCFAANKSYLNKNTEKVKSFLKAVMKGYKFLEEKLAQNDIDAVYNAIAPSFSGYDRTSIYKSIESYYEIDAWTSSPVMQESAYERLLDIMQGAGQLTTRVPMSQIIDNTIAQELINELQ